MTYEEAIKILHKDMELCLFNPMTGETKPMNEDCRLSAEALKVAIEAIQNDETTILRKYHAWLLEQFIKNPTEDNLHSIDKAIGWLKLYGEYRDINISFGVCTYDENYFKPCEMQAIDCENCEWNDVVK